MRYASFMTQRNARLPEARDTNTAPAVNSRTRATIDDVAHLAGVSKSTVSFVVNGRPGISDDARDRVLRAAQSLGWKPSARARALSRNRAQTVGLVIRRPPELLSTDPFFPQFVSGVEVGLSAHDYALILQVVADAESERAAYSRFARDSRVDGAFLTDVHIDDERPAMLSSLGIPVVIVAPAASDVGEGIVVGLDDGAAVSRAVHHLHALGHSNIGYVMGTSGYVHTEIRRDAWENTLRELGLPSGPVIGADLTGHSGAQATHELLDARTPPTAIVYGNDLMAIAGVAAATERGLTIPTDLSIVGFDDAPLARYTRPPLTTVRQDVVAWGTAAAEALIAIVEGREPQQMRLPQAEFIVRGSTARAPSR